jgi:hypothetical protein
MRGQLGVIEYNFVDYMRAFAQNSIVPQPGLLDKSLGALVKGATTTPLGVVNVKDLRRYFFLRRRR